MSQIDIRIRTQGLCWKSWLIPVSPDSPLTRPREELIVDQIFSQGLEQFDRLRIYGNA